MNIGLASQRAGWIVIAGLALVGLVLSIWLAYVHFKLNSDPLYGPGCDCGEKIDCEAVGSSAFSIFLDLPVAVWGILAYAIVLLLAMIMSLQGTRPETSLSTALLSGSMFVFSVTLWGISFSTTNALCLLGLAVSTINLAIAAVAILEITTSGGLAKSFADCLKRLRSNKIAFLCIIFSFSATLTVIYEVLPRYWIRSSWLEGVTLPNGVDENGNPWLGAERPKLVVHEYLDYECPHCRAAHYYLRDIIEDNPATIRLVRHDFARIPCLAKEEGDSLEKRCELARSAHCATLRGKFWEWNDAILASPKPILVRERENFMRTVAVRLGFDYSLFKKCLTDRETYEYSQKVYNAAIKRGIRETPSYIVKDKTMRLEELLELVN